jgi:TolB protein
VDGSGFAGILGGVAALGEALADLSRDFPAAPDPRGTHALIVAAFDEGDVHREQLLLLPLTGGDPLLLGPPAEAIRNPAWSPDGAFIVFE